MNVSSDGRLVHDADVTPRIECHDGNQSISPELDLKPSESQSETRRSSRVRRKLDRYGF